MILGVIVVVAVVNYWMLIPTVVMLVLFFLLRIYYIPTSRSIKRLEGISKLILFPYFTLYLEFIVQFGNVCVAYKFGVLPVFRLIISVIVRLMEKMY
jgi:hypothetical protein